MTTDSNNSGKVQSPYYTSPLPRALTNVNNWAWLLQFLFMNPLRKTWSGRWYWGWLVLGWFWSAL